MKILRRGIIDTTLISIATFLLGISLYSQERDTVKNYISYSNKLGLYVYGISKISNFDLKGTEIKQSIEYSPNSNFNLGAGFNYKWMGLAMAINFGFINNSDKALYGDTKSIDIQFEGFPDKYLISGNFQVYQSYYWKNPDDFYNSWNTQDSLIVKPNLTTVNLGVNVIHVFSHECFSLKAAYMGTERQLSSSGSWLMSGKASLYAVADDSSLVPQILFAYYPNASPIAQLSSINIGGSLGYSHTFIFKEFYFINLTFMLGINMQAVGVSDLYGNSLGSDVKFGSNAYLRFALGGNKDNKYYGISVNLENYVVKNPNETQFSYDYGKFKIYYGKRFKLKG